MYRLELNPRDLLFFGDARPLGAADPGAHWPLPAVLHEALLAAFHEHWPEPQPWEFAHQHRRPKHDRNFEHSSLRFGGLKTAGPLPFKDGVLCLPRPADLVLREEGSQELAVMAPVATAVPGLSNLPAPLRYPVARLDGVGKAVPGPWLSQTGYASYLAGQVPAASAVLGEDCIAEREPRVGIGIAPQTGSAAAHQFYTAEYLRLLPGVSLVAWAECLSRNGHQQGREADVLGEWFVGSDTRPLVLGGQQGVVQCAAARQGSFAALFAAPVPPPATGVKWTLVSPAVFVAPKPAPDQSPAQREQGHPGGWLPGWIDAGTGKVRLAVEGRELDACLVAARVPKPLAFSGWDLRRGGPKPTQLAVPAGSVYYFEAANATEAARLSGALHGRRRSDLYGEKGFGLGLCGAWELRRL